MTHAFLTRKLASKVFGATEKAGRPNARRRGITTSPYGAASAAVAINSAAAS